MSKAVLGLEIHVILELTFGAPNLRKALQGGSIISLERRLFFKKCLDGGEHAFILTGNKENQLSSIYEMLSNFVTLCYSAQALITYLIGLVDRVSLYIT